MSATDNQMTRFLFAILKQKNLKDIDWNVVARDPILTAPITNGHAARMRYSRFRSSMLGLEPQKRNRNPNTKNRVTKSKKDVKIAAKREQDDDPVKDEPGTSDRSAYSDLRSHSPALNVNVKHEMSQPGFHHYQSTPLSMASPVGQDCPPGHPLRLLTPCSDDMLSIQHNPQFSPQPNLLSGFDLACGPCDHDHDIDHGASNEPNSWAGSPVFPGLDYHMHQYMPELAMFPRPDEQMDGMHGSPTMSTMMPGHSNVKTEQWDAERR